MAIALSGILSALQPLMQGFGFGSGYGSGVRFGYNDLYPVLKNAGSQISEILGLNSFMDAGFKSGQDQTKTLNTIKY